MVKGVSGGEKEKSKRDLKKRETLLIRGQTKSVELKGKKIPPMESETRKRGSFLSQQKLKNKRENGEMITKTLQKGKRPNLSGG